MSEAENILTIETDAAFQRVLPEKLQEAFPEADVRVEGLTLLEESAAPPPEVILWSLQGTQYLFTLTGGISPAIHYLRTMIDVLRNGYVESVDREAGLAPTVIKRHDKEVLRIGPWGVKVKEKTQEVEIPFEDSDLVERVFRILREG